MSIGMFLIGLFTFVQLNCENLFDCRHDSLKQDYDFLPTSEKRWNTRRYWRKLNHIGREIVLCGETDKNISIPDLVALCEVENDSVMFDLTKRSVLRAAKYEYIMTNSPDVRGLDVALLYSPYTFRPINHYSIRIDPIGRMRPTRDVLYVSGELKTGDTLHVFVVHAPSRISATNKYRKYVSSRVLCSIDSIYKSSPNAKIIVSGDFNALSYEKSIKILTENGLNNISKNAKGSNGALGTYYYKHTWEQIDYIFCSRNLSEQLQECHIGDFDFLLDEPDITGVKPPKRTYRGPIYKEGYSDHLPLIANFRY